MGAVYACFQAREGDVCAIGVAAVNKRVLFARLVLSMRGGDVDATTCLLGGAIAYIVVLIRIG